MKVVSMPIKKEWFDKILSGEKKEEYRKIKEYWRRRLLHDKTTHLKLINGYGRDKPFVIIELKDIKIGFGKEEWGAIPGEECYILELGDIIEAKNIDKDICFLCDRTDFGSFLMPFNGSCPVECCIDSCKRYLESLKEKTTTLL